MHYNQETIENGLHTGIVDRRMDLQFKDHKKWTGELTTTKDSQRMDGRMKNSQRILKNGCEECL